MSGVRITSSAPTLSQAPKGLKLTAVKKEFKERDKEKRMKERAERKKEKDKDIIITEY